MKRLVTARRRKATDYEKWNDGAINKKKQTKKEKKENKTKKVELKRRIYSVGIIDEKISKDERKQDKKKEKWSRQKEQKILWESIRRE